MRLAVSKGLGKICMVVIICLIFVLPAVSCRQNSITNSVTVETDKAPSVKDYFAKTEIMVFLKLEVSKIYDQVFVSKSDIGNRYGVDRIILECKVLTDLYESEIEIGEKVIIPLYMGGSNINDYKNWFNSLDFIYVRTHPYSVNEYVSKNDFETSIQTDMNRCDMLSYDVLPVIDGAVYINMVDEFHKEQGIEYMPYSEISGIEDFCYEGISCEEFETNVMELSKEYDAKEQEKESFYEKEKCKIYSWFIEFCNAFSRVFHYIFCK